ncbi:MAG: methionine--tRNA ligase [Candidatus Pacearchaeota archaeon]|jgi:methionyl-tRNA synthetase
MAKNKFYVTTPIYYPNDIPHIGHAYTTIVGDVLARWNSLLGKDVFFLTGTDEHGKKIQEAAKNHNKQSKQFVDEVVPRFKEAWKKLNINYNRFIRTTDEDHKKTVQEILKIVYKKGDIYLGEYEGFYCVPCEAYYLEKDLVDGCCPVHKKQVDKLKEKSYFFKLSKYQKKLLEYYKKYPEFIQPESKRQEIINRVKERLDDLSISRTSFKWGIEIPFDKSHITYVWFDALTNYLSGVGYQNNKKQFKEFWPADVHLVGKDILWFHAVIWPAILMSTGIKLPKKIFAHGWWTFEKEKISKSRGKVVNVDELISFAGVDSARYFLLRETPFGQDGDFSSQALIERHNGELANKFGNLISRVSALAEKEGIKKTENKLVKKLKLKEIKKHIDNLEFDKALNEIFSFIDICNEYIQAKKPWEDKTKDKDKILYELADSIKTIAILLWPFIPETSEKIAKQFNFKIDYQSIKTPLKPGKIEKSEILFKKIEIKEENKQSEQPKDIKIMNDKKIEGIITMGSIDYKDWEKLDLRVGKIISVENIEGADKLYKLSIDIGSEKRTVCAGLKKFYTKEQLKNKKIILFVNLAPRMMRGIESQGMILAAVNEDESKVILISPEKDIEIGSKIR